MICLSIFKPYAQLSKIKQYKYHIPYIPSLKFPYVELIGVIPQRVRHRNGHEQIKIIILGLKEGLSLSVTDLHG